MTHLRGMLMGQRLECGQLGTLQKKWVCVRVSRHRNRFPEILEFHYLDVWDSGYCYDCVWMNQSIIDGRIHNLSTNQIQHVRADHQYDRLCQANNCAPVELRFMS